MRLLLVTTSYPPRAGGSGFSVRALARGLAGRGHGVRVLHVPAAVRGRDAIGPSEAVDAAGGVRVLRRPVTDLGLPVVREAFRSIVRGRALRRAVLAELAREPADVVHAQQGDLFAAVLVAARAAGAASVATVRDYAPICIRTTRFRRDRVCPGCGARALADCLVDRYGVAGALGWPAVPLGLAATRRRIEVASRMDRLIAVSAYVRDRLVEAGVRAPIDVILNVPPAAPSPARGPRGAGHGRYLLFAGKLNREKGADLLPAVARALPAGVRLVVCGEGPLAGWLDAERAGGAPLELLGFVPNEEVVELLVGAEALVLASRWAEPLSRLLLEARRAGAPVVALATGGTAELVRHEVDGLLVGPEADLAVAAAQLARDAPLRARLARAARDAGRALEADRLLAAVEASYERARGTTLVNGPG